MISIARAIARIVGRVVRFAGAVEADDQPHAAQHVLFLALHAADILQPRAGLRPVRPDMTNTTAGDESSMKHRFLILVRLSFRNLSPGLRLR